jgi:hypothetical protein
LIPSWVVLVPACPEVPVWPGAVADKLCELLDLPCQLDSWVELRPRLAVPAELEVDGD